MVGVIRLRESERAIMLTILVMMSAGMVGSEYILEDLVAMENTNTLTHSTSSTSSISSSSSSSSSSRSNNDGSNSKRQRYAESYNTAASNNDGELQKTWKQRSASTATTTTTSGEISRQKRPTPEKDGYQSRSGGASGGKRQANSSSNGNNKDEDDEDKKTLAQQVADGKYGLIQKEIFDETPPQRPGIISYEVNPEVPKDNVNNLGGLKPEEIWLAENHLLVLAGGGRYNDDHVGGNKWPPIDNYRAPPRQVKIPPNPKVPPPFPVQLRPGGPTEYIRGANGTGGPPPFPFFPPPGNYSGGNNIGLPPPFFGNFLPPGNFTPGNGPIQHPFPFPPPPPLGIRNGTIPPQFQIPPGSFPFPNNLPPGANILPPPGNITEPLDEDDPSIYYPPPYDFVYRQVNTTPVPPGPLVPGIVLPPPPDFFAPLHDEKRTKAKPKQPTVQIQGKRPQPTTTTTTQVPYRGKSVYNLPSGRRPAVQIVTDEPQQQIDLNQVTPSPVVPHILPPNAVVSGWVPIPAPKPFYITGPRKPLKATPTRLPPHGYAYHKPTSYIGENYTDPYLYNNIGYQGDHGSIYYETTTTTLAPPLPLIPTYRPNIQEGIPKGKSLKSFYYYDEPAVVNLKSRPYPPPQTYYHTHPPLPPHTHAHPTQINYQTTPKIPTLIGTGVQPPPPSPPHHQKYPIQYYYITKPPPSKSVIINNSDGVGVGVTTTRKPPIYEYSYTAPGYGTLEAPKLSGISSTPTPLLSQPYESPQYNYYDYDDEILISNRQRPSPKSTPLPLPPAPSSTTTTTPRPPISSSTTDIYSNHRPRFNSRPISYNEDDNNTSPFITQTENPYHAFFTHHDFSLIDDITKKYFTLFGQKINPSESPTTPLSPLLELHDPTTKSPPSTISPAPRVQYSNGGVPVTTPIYWSTQRPSTTPYPQQPQQYQEYYDDYYNNRNLDYRYKTIPEDLYDIGNVQSGSLTRPQQQSIYDTYIETPQSRNRYVQQQRRRPIDIETIRQASIISSSTTTTTTTPQPSLQHDTRVNFIHHPLLSKEAAAEEFESKIVKNPQDENLSDKIYYYNHRPQQQQSSTTTQRPILNNGDDQNTSIRPPSLVGDTNVNYLHPLPALNPEAEVFDANTREKIISSLLDEFVGRSQNYIQKNLPPSLTSDTRVNDQYARNPNHVPDPESEYYNPTPSSRQQQQFPPLESTYNRGTSQQQQDVIAYRLPGNGGGHFYFLTPQSVVQEYDTSYEQQNLYRRNVRRQNNNVQQQQQQKQRQIIRRNPISPSSSNNNSNLRNSRNNNNNSRINTYDSSNNNNYSQQYQESSK